MSTIHSKIEAYLGRTPDWTTEVYLVDTLDGNGPSIDVWNIADTAKPTTEQLDALDTEAQSKDDQKELENVRIERNAKLAETDWVVTMHKELGTNIPTAMKTYRAALRDITDSATSLDDVVWPEKP